MKTLLTKQEEQEAFHRVVERLSKYSPSVRKEVSRRTGIHRNTLLYWVNGKTKRAEMYHIFRVNAALDEMDNEDNNPGL